MQATVLQIAAMLSPTMLAKDLPLKQPDHSMKMIPPQVRQTVPQECLCKKTEAFHADDAPTSAFAPTAARETI